MYKGPAPSVVEVAGDSANMEMSFSSRCYETMPDSRLVEESETCLESELLSPRRSPRRKKTTHAVTFTSRDLDDQAKKRKHHASRRRGANDLFSVCSQDSDDDRKYTATKEPLSLDPPTRNYSKKNQEKTRAKPGPHRGKPGPHHLRLNPNPPKLPPNRKTVPPN